MPQTIKKFTEDNHIIKLLCMLALPTMISGLIDSLYNTVDSIFVGNFVGNEGLAALSVINVIQMMYISIGVLFSVGNASVISRALGAQHPERAKASLMHSFWGLFILSNIISFSILFNLDAFLKLIGSSKDVLPYARSYGSIILWTGFILPINNMMMGAFRAKGKTLTATYLTIIGAVLNIILDAVFIIYFGWGVAGAALATALGQLVVFIISIRKIIRLYNINFLRYNKDEINFSLLKEIFTTGMPTGLRLVLFVAVYSVANIILIPYGDEYLSAFGIFNRIIMLMAMLNISLSIGSQPLIGINYGAKLYDRVKKIIFITLNVGIGISILSSLFLWWAPEGVYMMFTQDPEIIRICQALSRPQAYTYVGWGVFICTAEALQAMGYGGKSFWLSMAYPLGVIFGFVVFNKIWGLAGVYLAFPFSYILVGIFAVVVLYRELHQLTVKQGNLKKAF